MIRKNSRESRRDRSRARAGSAGRRRGASVRSVATAEFLILSDGTVLAHNLTPAMADVLRALNPKDPIMSRRAQRRPS
jgi:hypothetical protein